VDLRWVRRDISGVSVQASPLGSDALSARLRSTLGHDEAGVRLSRRAPAFRRL